MKLENSATYHGPQFKRRRETTKVFYQTPYELHKVVLFSLHPKLQTLLDKADPDQLLHLEHLNLRNVQEEVLNYKKLLERKGVTVYLKVFEHFLPNVLYASDTFFSFKGNVYLSRMATDIRKLEEPFVYAFFHSLNLNPMSIFGVGEIMEASDLLYTHDRVFIGKGHRTNAKAIQRLKDHFSVPCTVIELPDDIQHLMGAVRVLSEEMVAVRHEKLSNDALAVFSRTFSTVLKVGETNEVVEKQAFNIVPYESMRIIMPNDCPNTENLYEHHGIEVDTLDISEIRKGGGGLACITGRLE